MSENPFDKRLREIRERCEAATEGPWTTGWDWDKPRPDECSILSLQHGDICRMSHDKSYPDERVFADARFIRYARGDVPWLLEELEWMRKQIARLAVRDALRRAGTPDLTQDVVAPRTSDPQHDVD